MLRSRPRPIPQRGIGHADARSAPALGRRPVRLDRRRLVRARGSMDVPPLGPRGRRNPGRARAGAGSPPGPGVGGGAALPLAGLRPADFPVAQFGPVLDRIRDEILNGRGFVLIRGLPVEGRPTDDSATSYWGIGAYLGNPRSQNAKGHLLGHVRDLGLATGDPNVRTY